MLSISEHTKSTTGMCGHDHNLQHICESTSPVDYTASGAGHLSVKAYSLCDFNSVATL